MGLRVAAGAPGLLRRVPSRRGPQVYGLRHRQRDSRTDTFAPGSCWRLGNWVALRFEVVEAGARMMIAGKRQGPGQGPGSRER
eukprot:CAMPEP_0118859490 /NCGR_PEP_ID=MMETSP1163-20130328/5719_1 /TAXON_ID=124430 /ORGANISM="Phaeomonas parva, Strain CCMP2877" /LENGTH=82 /DNA_ID=CAMNT_0006793091 /DNA_START=140 /DNA_END=388 /DNA_ORIENTATION=-